MVNPVTPLFLKAAQYAEENPGMPNAHLGASLLPLERTGGFVFGVLNSYGDQADADVFQTTVFHHLGRLAETLEEGVNVTHRFEQLLQAINESLAKAFQEDLLRLPIAEASGIIGVASDAEIIVSGFGQLSAQFLHKTEKERFEQYDLARSMRVEDEVSTWQKPFLTVLNGELHPGDVFYLGTRINRHDLTQMALNEILTSLPPTSAINKMRQHLPLETAFAAVILRAERIDGQSIPKQSVEQSLSELGVTKERTQHYLGEQSPEVGSWMTKAWLIFFPKRGAVTRAKLLRRSLRLFGRLLMTIVVVSFAIVRDILRISFRGMQLTIRHPSATINELKLFGTRADHSLRSGISHFNHLPKSSKRILILALAILFIFIVSLIFINKQQTREMERRAYADTVEEVENKLETAEASLIYGDEKQARAFLNEADELIIALDRNAEERITEAERLDEKVQEMQNALRHLAEVEPTVIDKVADEIFGEPVTAESLGLTRDGIDVAVYNSKAYLLSPNLNQIFKHNRAGDKFDGGAAWILSNNTNIGDATAITIDGFVWVLKADGVIIKYLSGREETFSTAVIDPVLLNATEIWTDETSAFLYVLDQNQKRIIVFNKENGALVIQYTSPVFEFLRRIKVDEANKTIYVEAGTSVYQFTSM
ncbi:MAG: hypothetical protein AAB337_03295 [Patescibacteria group bacterium]